MATYMTTGINDAQMMIDDHPVSAVDGRCVSCWVEDCTPRRLALWILRVEGRLPRRRAGATRPELIGARRVRVW